jgi:hypothetical protein
MIPIAPPKPVKKTKEELNAEAEKFKQALESQIENIKEKGLNIGKIALIVGGIAFGGYILVDFLTKKSKKKNNKKSIFHIETNKRPESKIKKESWIVKNIKGYMLAFLIGVVREKIFEALAELKKEDAKSDL